MDDFDLWVIIEMTKTGAIPGQVGSHPLSCMFLRKPYLLLFVLRFGCTLVTVECVSRWAVLAAMRYPQSESAKR